MSGRSDRTPSTSSASSVASSSGERGRVLLLPIELTKAGEAAIEWVLQTRYSPGDEVVLLHVLYNSEMSRRQAGRQHARKAQAEHFILDRFALQLAACGVQFSMQVNFVLVDNWKATKTFLAQEISRVAEEIDADCIVLGGQQRNPVQKLLSVSQSVEQQCRELTGRAVHICPASFSRTGVFEATMAEEPVQRLNRSKAKMFSPSGHKGPFVTKSHGYQDVIISFG